MRLKTVIIMLLLPLGQIFGQNTLTAEMLWQFGRVALQDVSPDGKNVLYSVTRYNVAANKGQTELFIIPTAGGEAKQVSNGEGSKDNARFHPNGTQIGYLWDGTFYQAGLDGSAPLKISEKAMNGFGYLPNGMGIYFAEDVPYFGAIEAGFKQDMPKSSARIFDDLMYRHWKSWEDNQRSNIFVADLSPTALVNPVNIMDKQPFDCPMMPMGGMEQIAVSPNGKFIAYTCKKNNGKVYAFSTNSDIYLYSLEAKTTQNVSAPNAGYDQNPVFSPDGRYLSWNSMLRDGYEADRNRLVTFNLQNNTTQITSEAYDNDTGTSLFSANSNSIFTIAADNGIAPIMRFNIGTAKPTRITPLEVNYNNLMRAGNELVVERVSMSAPVELFVLDPVTGKERVLTKVNTALLSPLKMGKIERRIVETTDGKSMLVYMVFPPDFDESKKYPALLYCQGGPQSPITQNWSYRWNVQLMAAKGYVVVMPCRRGMQGFGQAWNEQISGDWGGQAMQDLLSAIDDVAEEDWIDKARLGAVGASFGGYSVYWLAGHHKGRFNAFIAHCGVYNTQSMYATTEEMWFNNWDFKGPYWDKSKENKTYTDFSPHNFVQNWDTPMLVIHCEKDFRVPVGEGIQAFNAAITRDVKARFLYFDDEGHWVNKPQNGVVWQRVFYDWLDTNLKAQ